MAELVFKDAFFSIDGVNLSSYLREVRFSYGSRTDDKTASGDGTFLEIGTLLEWSFELVFNQDFAESAVDATLFPKVGKDVSISFKPVNAATSSSNPNFTGTAVLKDYPPFTATVGSVVRTTVTLRPASTLVRATS